jgi:hypothetical protein
MLKKFFHITSILKIVLAGLLYVALTASPLYAEEQTKPKHNEAEHYHQNIVELFLGNTYEDGDHGSENGFTVAIAYERRFSELFGIGGFYEYASGDFDKWSIGIPFFLHPYKGLRFQAAPGLEHRDSENEFLFRLGVAYDFILTEKLMLLPEIAVDFVDGDKAFIYGFILAYGF